MSDMAVWSLAVIVLINTGFIAGLTFLLWKISQKLDELAPKVDPLTARAAETLGHVERIAEDVEKRAHQILEQTTRLVESVSRKVDTTTAVAEEAVSKPLIGAASLMAGISAGVETYQQQGLEKGDSE